MVSGQDGSSFVNRTEAASSQSEDDWTLVTSKRHQSMSMGDYALLSSRKPFQTTGLSLNGKSRSSFDSCHVHKGTHGDNSDVSARTHGMQNSSFLGWPSLPGPSNTEDESPFQGSNQTAFGDHVDCNNRVLRTEETFQKSPMEEVDFNLCGFTNNASYLQQSSSSGTTEVAIRKESPLVTENKQPFISQYEPSSPGLAKSKVCIPPFLQASATNSRTDCENAPISQWKSLEEISSLKIHQTLDFPSSGEKCTLTTCTKTQYGPYHDITTDSSNFDNNSIQGGQDKMPKGVVFLCNHFLQDRKTAIQPPYICFSCSKLKYTNFVHGIWRSSEREWQLMRPYPKDVHPEVPFQICRHYRNGLKCRPSCSFAHGEEELTLWTRERQTGRNDPCVLIYLITDKPS